MTTALTADRPVGRQYLEDYDLNEVFISPARTITEADVVQFASLTGDWHALHTDAEYARSTTFGERIAHGMLTLSVGMVLVLRLGPSLYLPSGFIAMTGIDNVRFLKPVRFGDTIHSVSRVAALEPKSEQRGILKYSSEILNQHDQAVLVWTSRMLVARRPTGEPPAP